MCKGKDLYQFLDLGYHPHSDQFRNTNDEPEMHYPLRVLMCKNCNLAQLAHVVDAHDLYQKDYLYEASITQTASMHWFDFAEDVIAVTGIKKGKVLDIGSNDGSLLMKFKFRSFDVLGVDPCFEVGEIARNRHKVPTITDFYPSEKIQDKFNLITGTNVFAHVDDLDAFMEGIVKNLGEKGVFVFESPYLLSFLEGLEYDTVYHQHLSYLSLKPVMSFVRKFGLEVFDAKRTGLHGGGFRVYICRKGEREINHQALVKLLEAESAHDEQDLWSFENEVTLHRAKFAKAVADLYNSGKTIACVSAPAKGMTLLNATGVGQFISFVTEKSLLKIGRYTPGTKIKIYGDDELLERQPDVAIILAWNFAEEIMRNNPDFEGTWLIPLPTLVTINPTSEYP